MLEAALLQVLMTDLIAMRRGSMKSKHQPKYIAAGVTSQALNSRVKEIL
jgi:hypothetical protein